MIDEISGLSKFLEDSTVEILAIGIVLPTVGVMAYQALMQQEVTMPTTFALIIVSFYFGKKTV